MKARLDHTTTPKQKMERFNIALAQAVRVSKEELNRLLEADEKERRLTKNKPGPKPSSPSGRVLDSDL